MGIETAPLDVEEATEPPICAYSQEHKSQYHSHPRDVKDTHDIEKASPLPEQADETVRHPGQDLPSTSDHAHTIDPSSLSAILNVDLQCVALSCITICLRVEGLIIIVMDFQTPRRPLASHATGQIVSGRWRDYPHGRSS